MQEDSITTDRARSEAALKNRSLIYREEMKLDMFRGSYPVMNRMTIEHICVDNSSEFGMDLGNASSFNWFRFRQPSIRKLTIPSQRKSFYAKIPAGMIQRCRNLDISDAHFDIGDTPLDRALQKIALRAKNIIKGKVSLHLTHLTTHYKIRSYFRTLSSSCQQFELKVNNMAILKDSIRVSNTLKHLKLVIPPISEFNFIEECHQKNHSLETLSLHQSVWREDQPEKAFKDDRFWKFLTKQNKLRSFNLSFTSRDDNDFDFNRLLQVMSEHETLKNLSILIQSNPVLTMNLFKAHLNTKTKFESFKVSLGITAGGGGEVVLDESHLSLMSQIFGSSLSLLETGIEPSICGLSFTQSFDGEKYNMVKFEYISNKNQPYFWQYLEPNSHLNQLILDLKLHDDKLDRMPSLFDKLSQSHLLEKLVLHLTFDGRNWRIPMINEFFSILGKKVFTQTKHLRELELFVHSCRGCQFDQTVFTQITLAIGELRNLRILRFYFENNKISIGELLIGAVSIAQITDALKQMKRLEYFEFFMNKVPIDEREIENLIAGLANLKYLSDIHLRLCPKDLGNQLSEKLPGLINQLNHAEWISMELLSQNEFSEDNADKLLQTLSKKLVHKQTMKFDLRLAITGKTGVISQTINNNLRCFLM